MTAPVNIVCMKWGTVYGPHYVNRLHAMVARQLDLPFRFMCFTDDPTGIDPKIETAPLPPITLDAYQDYPWKKLALFNRTLADLEGTALFLDLDLIVVDRLEPFFEYEPGKLAIIHNWTHPDRRVGNSSVFRFEIGADPQVLDTFHEHSVQHWVDLYRNEQAYLSHMKPELVFWPGPWCVSFKKHCLPKGIRRWFVPAKIPEGTKIVVFHGHPKPDEAFEGRWPGGIHKRLRPARWIGDHWRE
ncbi:hypothetical protein [Amorphus orientalis]|uniref:Glycosyltransferase n=1 Tax=Amorphus orientalis TaxID=649198 RepID=A0AAE3VRQ4_9HYPH|nr:hypothetical protein [Amorphus orientalis]MDQ0316758.1 hypothetical protein [Amorphus orientalis]